MKLAVLRHGPTEWNAAKRLQGRTDISLSPEGREVVRGYRLPEGLKDWRWYSSPLSRARETAVILCGQEPIRDERLIERSFGSWEGLTATEVKEIYDRTGPGSDWGGLEHRPEGGESYREVQARLRSWLAETARNGEDAVVVTHKGVMTALHSLATGWLIDRKPAQKMKFDRLQLFELGADGSLSIAELNIAILPETTE